MTHLAEYDVIVLGGGLAGLCIAIELKRRTPGIRVLILEKGESLRPEAAHKVGESSVEMASHYFRHVLGVADLLEKELPKFGLRFFMSEGGNRDITRRLECGPKNFLTIPSDQIDRGQFENGLTHRALSLGVEFFDQAQVTGIELSEGSDPHRVRFTRHAEPSEVSGRWVVDASGRAALLRKKLGLSRASRHKINAAWFRIDHPIDPDDWSDDPVWLDRLDEPRRLSTNHLMGEGYWVWIIPLVKDRTSVGIVADESLHPFKEIHTFDKAMVWLEAHEPQLAGVVREHSEKRMDFLALKNYTHDVKRMFSPHRWGLTGDAGLFVDPLYSPGSDFIGLANGFICDLIRRDLDGENIDLIVAAHDRAYRSMAKTYLFNYYRQYPLMGHPRVMIVKIVWDFVMYWGSVAIIFCGDRMCDPSFMERAAPLLRSFASTNVSTQSIFRTWAKSSRPISPTEGVFVDYAGLGFLAKLNADLAEKFDDDSRIARIEHNLSLARALRLEIIAEANRTSNNHVKSADAPTTRHLEKIFELMRNPESEKPFG